MKVDTAFFPTTFDAAAQLARRVEDTGFDGLWSAETSHDPFFPLVVAARETPWDWSRYRLSTQPNGVGKYLLGPASKLKRSLYSWLGHSSQRPQRTPLQCEMGVASKAVARSDFITARDLGFLAE